MINPTNGGAVNSQFAASSHVQEGSRNNRSSRSSNIEGLTPRSGYSSAAIVSSVTQEEYNLDMINALNYLPGMANEVTAFELAAIYGVNNYLHNNFNMQEESPAVDQRSPEEIARTLESHQSRPIIDREDLPAFYDQLGVSAAVKNTKKEELARSYIPRLNAAEAELNCFLAEPRSCNGELALGRFRAASRKIHDDLEEQHVLDSPDTLISTDDYNKIMEALGTMFRSVPNGSGFN